MALTSKNLAVGSTKSCNISFCSSVNTVMKIYVIYKVCTYIHL